MTREIDLSRFPRFTFLDAEATPIQPLDNINRKLAEAGRRVRIFVKRDDLIPLGGGGNKLRKLEFLIGDAISQGADTIVTFGGRQSNHARQTAAAAAKAGLACELILSRVVPRNDDPDYDLNGNVLLDRLFGARIHDVPAHDDAKALALQRVAALRAEGRRAYVAPSGGSSPVGCLGYVGCASEIALQSDHHAVSFAQIVVAGGSNGTQAGLVAGFAAMGSDPKLVKSYTVLAPLAAARAEVLEKAQATAALIDPALAISSDMIVMDGAHRGEAYGIPTDGMRAALELMARSEGLLLDPVYSGKAFAGLLHDISAGAYPDGASVLFIMTGGTPSLFAYRSALT